MPGVRFAKAAEILIDLIRVVSRNAAFVTPELSPLRLPDPKDQAYLDAAIAAGADVNPGPNAGSLPSCSAT